MHSSPELPQPRIRTTNWTSQRQRRRQKGKRKRKKNRKTRRTHQHAALNYPDMKWYSAQAIELAEPALVLGIRFLVSAGWGFVSVDDPLAVAAADAALPAAGAAPPVAAGWSSGCTVTMNLPAVGKGAASAGCSGSVGFVGHRCHSSGSAGSWDGWRGIAVVVQVVDAG